MAHQGKRITNKLKWFMGLLFFLTMEVLYGQPVNPVSFQYSNPRNGKSESASSFLCDFALRLNSHESECYYAMGWYRFRVRRTGIIDSIAFNGDIHLALKSLGEKSIRESQTYWKCDDCEKTGGHWFTIPVLVAFTTTKECSPNPLYSQSVSFWQNLFKNQLNEQLLVGKNEWLLAPMYAIGMK